MKKNKHKKILFCSVDIGGRIAHYSQFLNKKYPNKVVVHSFVKFKLPKKHYKTSYTYSYNFYKYPKVIQWVISFYFFIYAIYKYNIFYIISGENILTRKLLPLELWIYKILKKKVIMHFVGADIRNSDYLRWKNQQFTNPNNAIQPAPLQSPFQERLCHLAQQYADDIIVTSPDLIDFFTKKVIYIPVFLQYEKFLQELNAHKTKKQSEKIVILHAPSNPPIKGTEMISKVLYLLEKERDDIKLIITTEKKYNQSIHPPYTVTKYKLLSYYSQCDILIDQLVIGWYGLQTVEGIAAGKATICKIEEKLKEYVFPDCPIYKFGEVTELKEKINLAIEDVKNKRYIKDQSNWVKKHHDINNNSQIKKLFDSYVL